MLVVALLFWAAVALGDSFGKNSDWDGIGDFLELARDESPKGVIATQTLDLEALQKEDAVILIHPDRALDVESLSHFMRDGGRVVLFDDFGTGDQLLTHFGIERVALPAEPALVLRHNPALALAEPAADHPVVVGVDRVVLNHASGLRHHELSPVLRVRAADGGEGELVGLAGAVGQGRLLAISDSSVVINGMLRYPGNRLFARNVLHYALDDDAVVGKRHGKVYVMSGDFAVSGAYGDESSTTSFLDRLRAFRELLEEVNREGIPPLAAFLVAASVGLGIVLWVSSRAARTHEPIIPRYTRAVPVAAQGGVAGHAAVIAAPGTTRALAVLELKSALEEELCAKLELDRATTPEILARHAASAGVLSDPSARDLHRLLVRMAEVETLVLSRRSEALRRVRDADVLSMARVGHQLLNEMKDRAARS